jgi:hypothetical protein
MPVTLAPNGRTLSQDHISFPFPRYSCVEYLYVVPSPGLGEGALNPYESSPTSSPVCPRARHFKSYASYDLSRVLNY